MEYYKSEIIRIIIESDNIRFVSSVYSFIKGIFSVWKGGESHE